MRRRACFTTRFFTSLKVEPIVNEVQDNGPKTTKARGFRMFTTMVRLLLIVLALGAWQGSLAQDDLAKKLEDGVNAFRMYNLADADQLLGEVLADRSALTQNQLGEALYYYSRAQFQLFVEKGNADEKELASLQQQQRAYKAYNLLLELSRVDHKRWNSKAEPQMRAMCDGIYRGALVCLDLYFNQADDPKRELYRSLATGYISLAATIDPINYVSHELYGQLYFFDQQAEQAAYHFDECLRLYGTNRMNQDDNVRLGDVYNKRARMFYNTGLYDTALVLVNDGLELIPFEVELIRRQSGAKYTQEEVKYAREMGQEITQILELLKLEIYARLPEKYDEGLSLFMEWEDKFKDNPQYNLFRGQLVEDKKPFTSLKYYVKSAELDPEYFDAFYHAGALYFALGSEYREQALKADTNQQAYLNNAVQLFKTGYPFMRKAHELDPGNTYVIESLYHAAHLLNLKEDEAYFAQLLR